MRSGLIYGFRLRVGFWILNPVRYILFKDELNQMNVIGIRKTT